MDVDSVDLPGSCADEARVELAIRLVSPTRLPAAGLFDRGVFHGLWHAGEDWYRLQSLTRLTQIDRPQRSAVSSFNRSPGKTNPSLLSCSLLCPFWEPSDPSQLSSGELWLHLALSNYSRWSCASRFFRLEYRRDEDAVHHRSRSLPLVH